MAIRTSLYRMTERMVGGDLESRLRVLRASGETWEYIARQLHVDHGTEVTGQTLRMWARQLGIPTPDAESDKASA